MIKKIAIIDYGMGNLGNVRKALENLGFPASIVSKPSELPEFSGAILPGVGAFGAAMAHLKKSGFIPAIHDFVGSRKPFLGICLGLQLLFEKSEESKNVKGLSLLPGQVIRFRTKGMKIPHIGWNQTSVKKRNLLLKNVKQDSYFYYVHSYYALPSEKSDIATVTEYGGELFTSGVCRNNLYAFQFHPEKSQDEGLKIYRNFGKLCLKK